MYGPFWKSWDVVGYVPADAGFALCCECADAFAKEQGVSLESEDEYGRPRFDAVFADSSEAFELVCDGCFRTLADAAGLE